MDITWHLAIGVLVVVAATGVSRRIGIAAPLLLVVIGAGISFIPGAPPIVLEPDLILLVVLPPLLWAAAVNFPLIDFRRNLSPIVGLGVVLVIVNAFVIGLLLWWLLPELDLASAIALGAVVSPTDAVSATSIAQRVGLPSRIVTILEGESLINDAAALVLMRTAVAGIAASVDLPQAVGGFAWSTLAAVVVGGAIGFLAVIVRRRFRDAVLTTSISFVVPFLAYLPAEQIDASGVIAVVTAGLIVGNQSVRTQTVQLRLAEQTNWRTLQFLLENGVFLLMGYQLQHYILDVGIDHYSVWTSLAIGGIVIVVLIAVRLGFVFPLFGVLSWRSARIASGKDSWLIRARRRARRRLAAARYRDSTEDWQRRLDRREASDRTFHAREQIRGRGSTLIGWSGMRGVVTVAAAQALPAETPYRSSLILIAFTVAAGTLLLGGLTLPGVARLLGLREPAASVPDELRAIFDQLGTAARQALSDPQLVRRDGQPFSQEAIGRVVDEIRRQAIFAARIAPKPSDDSEHGELRELRMLAFRAEREALADARATSDFGSTSLAAAESILNTLEGGDAEDA